MMNVKNSILFLLVFLVGDFQAQISKKTLTISAINIGTNKEIPALIPKKLNDRVGYVNHQGKFVIKPVYQMALFFEEDCNILSSTNDKVKAFGTAEFATVVQNHRAYRINKTGKIVYEVQEKDLGKCIKEYKRKPFHAYVKNGKYGVIEDAVFQPFGVPNYTIEPQYDYLSIMESEDPRNPMVVASKNDLFGIIDLKNNIIIPFIYQDIKRNYSWKSAKMFEVTKDNQNYFYIDKNNKAY